MKTVLAFAAGVLVGVLLAFACALTFLPDLAGRWGACVVLPGFFNTLKGTPARISAALDALTAPAPTVLRRPVTRRVRMARTGVVLAHFILPDDTAAAGGAFPGGQPPAGPSPSAAAEVSVEAASRAEAQPMPSQGGAEARTIAATAPDRQYALALKAYRAGRHAEARQLFSAFLRDHPGHALAPNALYWTGETWYDEGRYDQAVEAFERVVREHPRHAKSPDALLKLAYAAMRRGRPAEARAWLDQLTTRYPDSGASRLGRQARGRLQGRSGSDTMVAVHG